jgi:phosphoribosyl 1,2-cyclic phosphate phosphodiesterase
MIANRLEITILGCGSSAGVPRLGGADGSGDWGACDPANPKNRRRRCSLLLRRGDTNVLVDTSPDMREQLLAARVTRLDAVLMTHPHAD